MKITAVVDYGGLQVSQIWDFIPKDEQKGEHAMLILNSFANGDMVGISLATSKIRKQHRLGVADFRYIEPVSTADAELIPRDGKSN